LHTLTLLAFSCGTSTTAGINQKQKLKSKQHSCYDRSPALSTLAEGYSCTVISLLPRVLKIATIVRKQLSNYQWRRKSFPACCSVNMLNTEDYYKNFTVKNFVFVIGILFSWLR